MKNNTKSSRYKFRKSLCISNFDAVRKKCVAITVICAVLWCFLAIGHSYAGTWKDEFDGNELNGWERIVEENPWFAKWSLVKGALYTEIINHQPQDQFIKADFLHWNAHHFNLNRITVKGEKIYYRPHTPHISGEFCLFLGNQKPEPDFTEGYIFSPEETAKMRFSVMGDFKKGDSKAKYGLMWRLTRGNLKVVFDAGRFRLFTQDILVTEFYDANITVIDVVGLLSLCDLNADSFEANISTFSVSGHGIPNHNSLDLQLQSTQLTTTWGELKRF